MLKLQAQEVRQLSADREREAQEHQPATPFMTCVSNGRPSPSNSTRSPTTAAGTNSRAGQHGQVHPPLQPGDLVGPSDATAVATFRDRAGTWWRTEPNGHLEELPPRQSRLPRPARQSRNSL